MRDGRVPEAVKLLEGSLPAVKKDSKLSFDLGWCFLVLMAFLKLKAISLVRPR